MNTPSRLSRRFIQFSLALAGLGSLAGCGLLLVGGTAATTAIIATDRRTAGEQVDDQTISLRISSEMNKAFGDTARIHGDSYAGRVLLVGDVPTEADRERAQTIVQTIPKVQIIDNYIRVGDLTPLSVRTNDTWITSKVKAQLVQTKDVPSRTIIITTERGVVYLMGKVTDKEGERAAIVASGIDGVNKVVKLFKIVSEASIMAEPGATTGTEPAPVTDASSTPTPADDNIQTMPVK
ncbi:BON domain-containing protein [Alcaligenaceae bacterium CGII-47]|nr:BON domain-containing protein [Alcaligenaceae bacterium CGII-47]